MAVSRDWVRESNKRHSQQRVEGGLANVDATVNLACNADAGGGSYRRLLWFGPDMIN